MKALHSENEALKSKLAKDALGDVMDQVQEIKGVKLLAAKRGRRGHERSP